MTQWIMQQEVFVQIVVVAALAGGVLAFGQIVAEAWQYWRAKRR